MQVYKITNKINGKSYIGQDSKDREHYFGSGKMLRIAIKKYGIENFTKIIVVQCNNREELDKAEIFWIAKLNTQVPNGYNLAAGGQSGNISGSKLSDETIKKMKESFSGSGNAMYGKHHDINTKKKMREKKVGKKLTENHKINIGKASELRWKDEEYRSKMYFTQKGNVPWNKGIKFKCNKKIERYECLYCKRLISKNNFMRHKESCKEKD